MDNALIGEYLAKLRKYYKITQEELAARLNVTRQAISKWETGNTLPDVDILMKLSDIYGVSINDILRADVSKIKYQKEIVFPESQKIAKNVMVIGCGRWGSFIVWYLDRIFNIVGKHKINYKLRRCKKSRLQRVL